MFEFLTQPNTIAVITIVMMAATLAYTSGLLS